MAQASGVGRDNLESFTRAAIKFESTTGTAVSDKAMPGRGWAIFFGIITVLAGMVMLASPFGTIALLTLVVGWWLIVLGAFEIGAALSLRKEASKSPV